MPERIAQIAGGWASDLFTAFILSLVGIAIGIGQLLGTAERLTPRLIWGRALSSGGLAMAAGAVLLWVPELPLLGKIGVAATIASLGISGLERMFQRLLQGKGQ